MLKLDIEQQNYENVNFPVREWVIVAEWLLKWVVAAISESGLLASNHEEGFLVLGVLLV